MSGPELKNCPFCGDAMEPYGEHAQHPGDDCVLSQMIIFDDAYGEWNRRTPDPAQIRADALREALENAATTIKNLLEVMATPDQQQCCDGWMCGCMGSTVYQEAEYYALQDVAAITALLATPLSPPAVDNSPAPDAGMKGQKP